MTTSTTSSPPSNFADEAHPRVPDTANKEAKLNVGAPSRDDSDDLPPPSSNAKIEPANQPELEHGPLIFVEDGKVKTNLAALADKFAVTHSLAYSVKTQTFFTFEASQGIWVEKPAEQVLWLASKFLKTVADENTAPALLAKRTPSLLKAIMTFVQSGFQLGDPPTHSARLLPVANGVLDLSGTKAVLRPFKSDDFFTNKLAIAYNPTAECPRFLGELLQPALADPDDLDLYLRDIGRTLIPGNDAQRISISFGEGGCGKSITLCLLEGLLGNQRVADLRTQHLSTRFEMHFFQGRDILAARDVNPDFLAGPGASMLKSLTGADRFETEKKRGGKFAMRGKFYVFITANSRLPIKIRNDASAWRRRILCHQFNREVPAKRILDFDEVLLREEGEGILALLVRSYFKHRAELDEIGDFKLTEAQQKRNDNLVLEGEGQVAFARLHIIKGVGTLTVDEIRKRYEAFVREWGWIMQPHQSFCQQLRETMLELFGVDRDNHIMRNGAAVRGYKGVKFTSGNNEAASPEKTN